MGRNSNTVVEVVLYLPGVISKIKDEFSMLSGEVPDALFQ